MKVCVIGDSHLAAMKQGWENIAEEFSGISLTFFGAPAPLIEQIRVEDGAIVPTSSKTTRFFRHTSGGAARIDASYDRVLVCGMKFGFWRALVLYQHCRREDEGKDERQPLSDACYARAIEDYLADTPCIATLGLLRGIGAGPVGIVPSPYPSEESRKPGSRELARARGDEARVARNYANAAEGLGRRLGFRPFLPPTALLASPLATKAEYARDSVALMLKAKAHDAGEYLHMNAAYGAAVLRAILPDILALKG
jgi:hypothetical protein